MVERFGVAPSTNNNAHRADSKDVLKCLTTGFFAHAAKQQPGGDYATVSGANAGSQGGVTLQVHPTSLMFNRKAEWVIFGEVVQTGGGKRYMRDVSKVERGWLVEGGGGFYGGNK